MVAGLAVNFAVAKPPFAAPTKLKTTLDGNFIIINGWVLTREDVEAQFNAI
jgi:hypothetical protein